MSFLIRVDELSHETEFVWLEDLDRLDYVRQSPDRPPTRKGKPRTTATAAWSAMPSSAPLPNLPAPSAPSAAVSSGSCPTTAIASPTAFTPRAPPAEAIDPRTLEPRVKGYKTERSEGGPPSRAMQELGIRLPL